jgi:CrcB protein
MIPPPRDLVLVAAGGSIGAVARDLLSRAVGHEPGQWPWATLAVNIAGAFALGVLVARLARPGPSHADHLLRLVVGVGTLGALTTLSGLARDAVDLEAAHGAGRAVAYIAASLVVGLAAGAAGHRLGAGPARAVREAA